MVKLTLQECLVLVEEMRHRRALVAENVEIMELLAPTTGSRALAGKELRRHEVLVRDCETQVYEITDIIGRLDRSGFFDRLAEVVA